jgi:uncharacterized protein YciI
MPEYCYLLQRPRATFPDDITPEETAVMDRHAAYLAGLLEQGQLILAGPCLHPEGPGISVFEAVDDAAARAVMEADPAVSAGLMTARLFPFRASLLRGRP